MRYGKTTWNLMRHKKISISIYVSCINLYRWYKSDYKVRYYLLIFLLLLSNQLPIYGNNKVDNKGTICRKNSISLNPISPFISTYNICYSYRKPSKRLELHNSVTYFNKISFTTPPFFILIRSDLTAFNYLISLRKYKNTNLNHRFDGIGFRSIYIKSHDSECFWFLPLVHDAPSLIIPEAFYTKSIYLGINFEEGYTIYLFHRIILTFSISASCGIIFENKESDRWEYINKMVFFPSINATIGWLL